MWGVKTKLWKVTLPLSAMLAYPMHCPQQMVPQLHFFPQRHSGIIRRKICMTTTAMPNHTHRNKHSRGVSQKLLGDGELKYTIPIKPPEFCCVTGTLNTCSKDDLANLVHVHLLHLLWLQVRLHNPDWLPAGKIQVPNRSHSRPLSNIDSQSLRNYQ